jgi:hypothetical protein
MKSKLTKKDRKQYFIEKAREVHGDKYSYDKVIYIDNKKKVIISCEIHGEFLQTPSSHLASNGCKDCGIRRRSIKRRQSLSDFIAKAQHKHGGKYCYDQIKNYQANSKVPIICPAHGLFMMMPSNHLTSQGCKVCGVNRRANKCRSSGEKFIDQANRIHKNKYSYAQVNYLNARTKVIIECAKHGPFQQTPDSHLKGYGCNTCAAEQRGKNRELGMCTYIERASKKHKGFYDYSLIPSEGNPNNKVQIRCPKHGIFLQDFYQHSGGMGCPKCWNKRRNARHKTNDEFITDAIKKHGKKYDYSKANYINAYTKIKIICATHGSFEMTPTKHLSRGDGCPECGFLKRKGIGGITEARLKENPALGTVDAWIYIAHMKNHEESFFKVGHTTNKYPKNRFSFFNKYDWTIEHSVIKSLCEALRLENELKRSLPRYRPQIKFHGYTECSLVDPWPTLKTLLNP